MAFSRTLTQAEDSLCQHVFRHSIDAARRHEIEVVKRSDLVLHGGFTPYGRITVGASAYRDDYVVDFKNPPSVDDAHFFLHELGHVWQHFSGMAMVHQKAKSARAMRKRLRGAGLKLTKDNKFKAEYYYVISVDRTDLLDYEMEFQCEIIADYFALKLWKRKPPRDPWIVPEIADTDLPAFLEVVLANFLKDPSYVRHAKRARAARAWMRSPKPPTKAQH